MQFCGQLAATRYKHLRHGHSGNMNYNWATIIMILLVWNTLRKLCEGRDPDVVSNPNKQYDYNWATIIMILFITIL